MHEVVALAAIHHVVAARVKGREIHAFLEPAGEVRHDADDRALQLRRTLGGRHEHPMHRLQEAVAAGEDPAVVAEHAVLPSAAGHPVVALAAHDVVVLAVAKERVVARHAVDRVVACLAVDLIVERGVRGLAEGVAEVHDRPRHDLQAAVGVVVELQVAADCGTVETDHPEDPAVVTEDHVGVAGVAVGREVAAVVAGRPCARPTVDHIAAVRLLGGRREAEQVGTAADDVILAEVAEDHVVAAVALDVVVAIAACPRGVVLR